MPLPSPRRFYVPALDGLRVLACAMVFFHHGVPNSLSALPGVPEGLDVWYRALSQFGAYGVSIFFSLSAFLITRLLMIEQEACGRIDIRDFYLRRVLRIWPVYFIVLLLSVLLSPHFEGFGPSSQGLLYFATFTVNYLLAGGAKIPYAIGILWSVCVEEQFYLVWPQIVSRLSGEKALQRVGFAMVAIGWIARLVVVTISPTWQAVWFNALCHLDCFGWGVLLATLHARQALSLTRLQGAGIGFGALLSGWVLTRLSSLVDYPGPLPLTHALAYGFTAMIGGLVVLSAAFCPASLLTWKPLSGFGKYTYGLYSYHTLALVIISATVAGAAKGITAWLILSVGLAVGSYYAIETPFLRLKKRFQVVASGAPSETRPPVAAEPVTQST